MRSAVAFTAECIRRLSRGTAMWCTLNWITGPNSECPHSERVWTCLGLFTLNGLHCNQPRREQVSSRLSLLINIFQPLFENNFITYLILGAILPVFWDRPPAKTYMEKQRERAMQVPSCAKGFFPWALWWTLCETVDGHFYTPLSHFEYCTRPESESKVNHPWAVVKHWPTYLQPGGWLPYWF